MSKVTKKPKRDNWVLDIVKDLNVTQSELAREIGTSEKVVSFWVNEKTNPSPKFRRLLDLFVDRMKETDGRTSTKSRTNL